MCVRVCVRERLCGGVKWCSSPLTHIECREQCDKFRRDGSKIHEQNLQSFEHVSAVASAASVMAAPSFAQRSAIFVQLTNR